MINKRASVDRTIILGAVRIHEDTFAMFLSLVPLSFIDGTVCKPTVTIASHTRTHAHTNCNSSSAIIYCIIQGHIARMVGTLA